jgi:hypothetical protein
MVRTQVPPGASADAVPDRRAKGSELGTCRRYQIRAGLRREEAAGAVSARNQINTLALADGLQ